VHFPLKPLDLALKLPPDFVLETTADLLRKTVGMGPGAADGKDASFASALEAGLGRTICRDFYFPYARKLWGLEPEALSATQAQRRVSADAMGKLVRKVLSALPGSTSTESDLFFYPRRGFGQICEEYAHAACEAGAEVQLNATVRTVDVTGDRLRVVFYEREGAPASLEADYVWSTIPITEMLRSLRPVVPEECLRAAEELGYRAMVLIYLVLEQDQFTEFDAHYFPGPDVPLSRLSEPKNYSGVMAPPDVTVLCGELPCTANGPEWQQSDQELGQIMCRALEMADIPVKAPIAQVYTARTRDAYPIYRRGYEAHFARLDQYLGQIDGLLTFGRQGLFAHDNTHHALAMGYAAADCLATDGSFDRRKWRAHRQIFEKHVVVD
jgi:protoporphyrinogen oxidase